MFCSTAKLQYPQREHNCIHDGNLCSIVIRDYTYSKKIHLKYILSILGLIYSTMAEQGKEKEKRELKQKSSFCDLPIHTQKSWRHRGE